MIKTFQANLDPHKATAALIYNKSIDEVTKEERQSAKAINFGLSYGQGADSFREYAKTYGVHITREQAAEFKEKFRNAVPGLKKWHFEVGKKLKESAPIRVETLDGRILMVDKYTDALNYSIQGTGGGMSKLAINIFYRKLEDLPHLKPCTNVVNVVHDEIAVETNSEYKDEVAQLLKESMELAANFILRYFVTEVDID
jgi:DNA polymerase-1